MKRFIYALTFLLVGMSMFSQNITLTYENYQVRYDTIIRLPKFVVYTLTKAELAQNVNKTYFRIDKNVPTILQGNDTDYSNSGYDRGHLAPNNDFRFSKIAEYENMLYTNCAPQVPSFNRGVWATLESHVQDLVEKHGDAIIWTGCVYDGSIEICGNLPVPVYFWKLVYVDCKWYAWKMYNDDYSRAKFGDYTIDPFELLPLTQQ